MVEKYISYSKLSKKKKRERDRAQRETWGSMSPITRKAPNAKAYNRKKSRRTEEQLPGDGSFFMQNRGTRARSRGAFAFFSRKAPADLL